MAERINKENFAEKTSTGLVLVDFYSDSCIPCKKINPVLSELEEDFEGKVNIYKLNTGFDAEIAQNSNVLSTPTLILFKDGNEVDRKSGFQTYDVIAQWFEENL